MSNTLISHGRVSGISRLLSIGSLLKIKPCLGINISDPHLGSEDGLFPILILFAFLPVANEDGLSGVTVPFKPFRAIASW